MSLAPFSVSGVPKGASPTELENKLNIAQHHHHNHHHHSDLQGWLEKLVGVANDATAKGDMGRVFADTKKLRSGHDRQHNTSRHQAELLHGQETVWSELAKVASEHGNQHTGKTRMDLLTLHDIQSAWRKGDPSGISISEAVKAARAY